MKHLGKIFDYVKGVASDIRYGAHDYGVAGTELGVAVREFSIGGARLAASMIAAAGLLMEEIAGDIRYATGKEKERRHA